MKWFWDNSANINAIISIITAVVSGAIFIVGLVISFLRLKLKSNQYKYLNLVVDSQTKRSMKCYVSTRAQDIDPCDEENNNLFCIELIPFFIKQVFKESDEQYFIILADSGMGKTTFLLKLFFEYYKKVLKKYDIVFVPLALKSSIENIREIKNKSNTILLLDGFDEDRYAMEDYVGRLKDICNETELFYKVIMTCRTQFFPDSDSEPKDTDKIKFGVGKKSVEFKKYYISPFNDKEINIYLKKKYNRIFERNKIIRSKNLIENCPHLMVRPMLLSYLDDLLIDSTKKYKYAYEIYEELVAKWIDREAVENKLLYEFSEKVAEHMYLKKTVYIAKNEIEELCREYNIQIRSIEAKSRSLLNRNANGSYKFAHKSILEYFLAREAHDDLQIRESMAKSGFIGYDMVKHFLNELDKDYLRSVQIKNMYRIEALTLKFLQLSGTCFFVEHIIGCDFKGCDLSKSIINDVYFESSKLTNVNFQRLKLAKISFNNCDLTASDFRGADLKDVEFNNVILTGAIFDEKQVNYLGKKYYLRRTKVYISKTKKIVNYEEYYKGKQLQL